MGQAEPDIKECETCGLVFIPEEGYEYTRQCLVCWKTEKGYTLTKADKAFARLQKHLATRETELGKAVTEAESRAERAEKEAGKKRPPVQNPGLSAAQVKALIFLSHPDKHGNSELATETTKWLLDLRAALKGKK